MRNSNVRTLARTSPLENKSNVAVLVINMSVVFAISVERA